MYMNDLVTIGIPAYREAEHLREVLDSLLAQTYPNLEIIISADAPTDEVCGMCLEYARNYGQIQFYWQDNPLGIAGNYNSMLLCACGKYFVWGDQDDTWHPEYIERLVGLLHEHPDAVSAMCGVEHLVGDKKMRVQWWGDRHNNLKPYDYLMHYAKTGDYEHIGGMYVTEALRNAGGYHADSRPFFRSSDYVTLLRLALLGKTVYTDEVLFHKRDSGACHNAFAVLADGKLDRDTWYRIVRYLFFPLFCIYNLVFGIRYVARSRWRTRQKAHIIANLFAHYMHCNATFVANVFRGAVLYCGGTRH